MAEDESRTISRTEHLFFEERFVRENQCLKKSESTEEFFMPPESPEFSTTLADDHQAEGQCLGTSQVDECLRHSLRILDLYNSH